MTPSAPLNDERASILKWNRQPISSSRALALTGHLDQSDVGVLQRRLTHRHPANACPVEQAEQRLCQLGRLGDWTWSTCAWSRSSIDTEVTPVTPRRASTVASSTPTSRSRSRSVGDDSLQVARGALGDDLTLVITAILSQRSSASNM
jgi:hypothetical protein